jgi:hypothetical protein
MPGSRPTGEIRDANSNLAGWLRFHSPVHDALEGSKIIGSLVRQEGTMLPRINAKLGTWSLAVFGIVAGVVLLSTRLAAQKATVTEKEAFPILQQRCLQCHGEALKMSGLDLRTRAGILKGGTNGPAIVPGNAGASPLYQRITGQEQPAMPMAPVPRLTADEIAMVKTWIDAGAPMVDESKSAAAGSTAGDNSLLVYGSYQERKITDTDREWWSFKKPVRAAIPRVSDARWSKNPIDGFVKATLESHSRTGRGSKYPDSPGLSRSSRVAALAG